jgi:hypothetical protein
MEKIQKYVNGMVEMESEVTGHSKFREKYFNSFR